jgi:hypothetical protein
VATGPPGSIPPQELVDAARSSDEDAFRRLCPDALARRARRGLPTDEGRPAHADDGPGEPIDDPVWVEPYPDDRIGVAGGYAAPEARYEQREAVELAFIAAEPVHRYLPTRANAQLANGAYRWHPEADCYVAEALEILTLEGGRVTRMTAFMTPALFHRFGLPERLPPRAR